METASFIFFNWLPSCYHRWIYKYIKIEHFLPDFKWFGWFSSRVTLYLSISNNRHFETVKMMRRITNSTETLRQKTCVCKVALVFWCKVSLKSVANTHKRTFVSLALSKRISLVFSIIPFCTIYVKNFKKPLKLVLGSRIGALFTVPGMDRDTIEI